MVYIKVSGLAVWSENRKLYSSLPPGAVLCCFSTSNTNQSGNLWIHTST